ncbi:MAG: LacI family transcriptional regulator [Treponema sp.]|jgi:DNA-binding LacI/PurR family transcriptional regulator|nr:LacI family transcriptional regulator [Treponema sp.]
MKATIKDIAERAGCSKASVSFAFNTPSRVSKTTYNKIMQAAKELGYVPNPVARILATKKNRTIGFMLTQPIEYAFDNPYVSEILKGIASVCNEENFMLSILEPLKNDISAAIQQTFVGGIIVIGIIKNNTIHQHLKKRQMPYVTIDAEFQNEYLNIGIDEISTAEKLLDLFIKNGHKRICICTLSPIDEASENCSYTMTYRLKGIMNSFEKHSALNNEKIELSYYYPKTKPEEAIEEAKEILSKPNRPTAIYCMSDSYAPAFYSAAAILNIKIPNDLSIAGFDNLPISKLLVPPMTVVNQTGYQKGILATQLLINSIEGKPCSSIHIDSQIIERNSISNINSN